jgi:hypothetical protein
VNRGPARNGPVRIGGRTTRVTLPLPATAGPAGVACSPSVTRVTWGAQFQPGVPDPDDPAILTVTRELTYNATAAAAYPAGEASLALGYVEGVFCPGCTVSWDIEWSGSASAPFTGGSEPLYEYRGAYNEVVAVQLANYTQPSPPISQQLAVGVLTLTPTLTCDGQEIGGVLDSLLYVVFGTGGSSGPGSGPIE